MGIQNTWIKQPGPGLDSYLLIHGTIFTNTKMNNIILMWPKTIISQKCQLEIYILINPFTIRNNPPPPPLSLSLSLSLCVYSVTNLGSKFIHLHSLHHFKHRGSSLFPPLLGKKRKRNYTTHHIGTNIIQPRPSSSPSLYSLHSIGSNKLIIESSY